MLRFSTLLTALCFTSSAFAQSVQQSGTITPGHVVVWGANGVVRDGGTGANGNATSFGVTNNGGPGICINSSAITNPYNALCLSVSTSGNAQITLQNYNGATAQGLQFNVNGTVLSLPGGTGSTFITGTGPFATGNVPCFSNTSGAIQDCGLALASGVVTSGTWNGSAVAVLYGGSGSTTAAGARTNFGLGTIAVQNANNITVTGGTITGMPSPSANSDVATKSYVDSVATGLLVKSPVRLATAAVLPNTPTYSNGASGVGATLTAGSNAALTVDGTSVSAADRVLVKNQVTAANNGVYSVTTVGDGSTPWVITRVTDFDTAAEMLVGSYFFVSAGATNLNNSYVLSATVTTVGTTAATFFQFATGTIVAAGDGIGVTVSGSTTTVAVTSDVGRRSGTFTTGNLVCGNNSAGVYIDCGVAPITSFATGTVYSNNTNGPAAPTANTILALANGTASAPTYGFVLDPTTGAYRSAANFYDIAVGGVRIAAFEKPSTTNYFDFAAGATPRLSAAGGGANVDLALAAKASGTISFISENTEQVRINGAAIAVNYIGMSGSATGNAIAIAAAGTDTNIPINITPKGTGKLTVTNAVTADYTMSLVNSNGVAPRVLHLTMSGLAGSASNYFMIGSDSITPDNILIYGNGNIQNLNNSYGGISDGRLKPDFTELDYGLGALMQIPVGSYHRIDRPHDGLHYGVRSQDVEHILPHLVLCDPNQTTQWTPDGTCAVNYMGFMPFLIKSVQELNARLEAIERNQPVRVRQ